MKRFYDSAAGPKENTNMAKHIVRTGKQSRPKTAIKGKRYRCATCHKRSPKAVKTPAPWYCPRCMELKLAEQSADSMGK